MPTIEQLLASIGIGAAILQLRVNGKRFIRGAELQGALMLEGGDVAQRIDTLSVALRAPGTAVVRQVLASNIVVEPVSRHEFSFRFVIPEDTYLPELHYRGRHHLGHVRIVAEADIEWAANPRASVDIEVVEQPEIVAVQEALRALGFRAVDSPYIPGKMDMVHTAYMPPRARMNRISAAALDIRMSGTEVEGSLQLRLQQPTLLDEVKSLAEVSRVECPFTIPRSALTDEAGRSRAEGAVAQLRKILGDVLGGADDGSRRLLRATDAPDTPGMLLRPASGGCGQTSKELLRPSNSEPTRDRNA
jgi:hypothetical protein